MMNHEWVDLGPADVTWGGYEILGAQSHCQISRRTSDGALFAEIWIEALQPDCESSQVWQYIGPVRLPAHG
jgi:hypothetical protein